ncbi:MAG: hypothetical protein JSU73_10080 [candidate division WOR-3 bacterium]|nr:MAG: hypothetical protein JSU73_10080 [candidate division WOR-3 bacterium]
MDRVPEPGLARLLAQARDSSQAGPILGRVAISADKRGSRHSAVVGHHDCAGNPVAEDVQIEQLRKCVAAVQARGFEAQVVGLWVDENRQVYKVE